MRITRLLMGMPITVEVVESPHPPPLSPSSQRGGADRGEVLASAIEGVFAYFEYVDATFSTYKTTSEITAINEGRLTLAGASPNMQTIFALAEQTKAESFGYFDIAFGGKIDPSGVVKGWAIHNAAQMLWDGGFDNFYVDAGGDVQVSGKNADGENWRVGIRNPFNIEQIVKVLSLSDCGIATSGNTIRGAHIYDPHQPGSFQPEIVSMTVIAPNVYEADRFATAAFAMDRRGIGFIEHLQGFEGYMIDRAGMATLTSGFEAYVA